MRPGITAGPGPPLKVPSGCQPREAIHWSARPLPPVCAGIGAQRAPLPAGPRSRALPELLALHPALRVSRAELDVRAADLPLRHSMQAPPTVKRGVPRTFIRDRPSGTGPWLACRGNSGTRGFPSAVKPTNPHCSVCIRPLIKVQFSLRTNLLLRPEFPLQQPQHCHHPLLPPVGARLYCPPRLLYLKCLMHSCHLCLLTLPALPAHLPSLLPILLPILLLHIFSQLLLSL